MGDKPEDMESYKKAIDSTTEAQQDFFKKFSSLQLCSRLQFKVAAEYQYQKLKDKR